MARQIPRKSEATKSERTRQRILDAAAASFRHHGYTAVTLKDIAALANLQAGSLYYYFDSKEQIIEEVFEVGVAAAHAATRNAVDALGKNARSSDRLRVAITTHLTFILEESNYSAANLRLLGQIPEDIRERHLKHQRRYGALWQELVNEVEREGALPAGLNPSIVRMLLLGALNWSVEWFHPGGATPEEIADHLIALVLGDRDGTI